MTPQTSGRVHGRSTSIAFACVFLLLGICRCKNATAGEPAAEFVRQLVSVAYYDVAMSYLDRVATSENVDPNFRSSIEFERAQVHVAAAQTARSPEKLNEELELAEQSLNRFISAGEHLRRREAELQMASLQRIRADRLMMGEVDEDAKAEARKAYRSAGETFANITKAIREELQAMRGAKIDPSKDQDAASRRDQLRAEYLQGLVSGAEVQKLAAETFDDPSEKKAAELYKSALQQFDELADKYADYVPGATAKLYSGEIKEKLGEIESAQAAYTEMLEAANADGLREAKFRAAAGLLRLAKGKSPAEVKAAVQTANEYVGDIRPNERNSNAANGLQLTLAKAFLQQSDGGGDDAKKSLREGRKLLNQIVKLPGPHVEETKSLLSDLGIDVDKGESLPTMADRPSSTADAVVKAQQILQLISESDAMLKSLQGDSSADAASQRESIESQISENRAVASSLLMQGLAMVNSDTESQTIVDARQLLAYALSTGGRYREAIVVGRSLARLSPGTPTGLSGGIMALGSLQNLINAEPKNTALIDQLSTLADYLAKTWPDDPKAQAAKSAVVQLSLQNNDFEKASSLIAAMEESTDKASLQRLLGRMLYADAVQAVRDDDAARGETLRGEAAGHLSSGLAAVEAAAVDDSVAKAALTLAKIQMQSGDSLAAVKTIDHPVFGPSKYLQSMAKGDGKVDANFQSDLYSTELRAVVGTMTDANGEKVNATETLERAVATMEKLQAANSGVEAAGRLQSIYMTMARDIRTEIDTAAPARKTQLIAAFRIFLEKMAGSSKDQSTLRWIGQTLMSLGEAAITPGQKVATGNAADLLKSAIDTFDRLVVDGEMPSATVRFQQAKGLRLTGQYKKSIDVLESILKESPSMLDAQIDAALSYEGYATQVPEKFKDNAYAAALLGARKSGPKNENVIWGWGKISQLTSKNPKFSEKFFQARYHVALCRFLQGKAAKDEKIIRKAITDITQIQTLYPAMGGAEQKKKFEQLLAQIQKEVGQ